MPAATDTQDKVTDAGAQASAAAPQPAAPAMADHTRIKGRFNQYQSGYWSLAVPLLSARYIADGLNGVLEHVIKVKLPKVKWADKAWSVGVGLSMLGVTSFYTSRTYGDMKREFAEPLAWEFNKPPENVGLRDMLDSKNTLIHDAVRNFIGRSTKRVLADVPFFAYLIPQPFKKTAALYNQQRIAAGHEAEDLSRLASPKQAVNLGVGVNAMYLASDALGRKRTFFEELQGFIDNKINHSDRIGESVTAADLINLYDRQARNNPLVRPLPKMDTQEWQSDQKLFERMADLMNQTYGNKVNTEQANFTVPKLIYMLGMQLMKTDDPEKNLAYLEVANRYGIPAVEKVARMTKGQGDLKTALADYPDAAARVVAQEPALTLTPSDNAMLTAMGIAAEPAQPSGKTFANEGLKKARPEAPPAAQVDKITQNANLNAGMAIGS